MRAIEDSRAKLARASRELKATSTIVFEIRKILERQGFTDVSSDNGVGHRIESSRASDIEHSTHRTDNRIPPDLDLPGRADINSVLICTW